MAELSFIQKVKLRLFGKRSIMDKIVINHFKDRVAVGEYIQKREVGSFPVDVEGRVLEVGCGAKPSYSIDNIDFYGMDITPEMIRAFRENYPTSTLIIGDAIHLPFRKNVFQATVATDLLHHLIGNTTSLCVSNIKSAVSEFRRVLSFDGIFLIRDLCVRNYIHTLIMYYITLYCARFNIEINQLDIHSKVITYFLTKKKLISLLEETGFQIDEIILKSDWIIKGIKLGTRTEIHARVKGN